MKCLMFHFRPSAVRKRRLCGIWDVEKAEELNYFLPHEQVLQPHCPSHRKQTRDWEKEELPTVDQVQEHLRKAKGAQVHGT